MVRSSQQSVRRLRFETLETRELLSATRGLDEASFAALREDYPGFDYAGVASSDVLVLDASAGLDPDALRSALSEAKARPGADVIAIRAHESGTTMEFGAASDGFVVDDPSPIAVVAIGGRATIDAGNMSRIFTIGSGASLSLGGVSLINGSSSDGGAIYNAGELLLDRALLSNNAASNVGGAIYNSGELTVVNTIISGNRAGRDGGGVYSTGGYVDEETVVEQRFINATITGNAAGTSGTGFGGGIYFRGVDEEFNVFAEATLENSIVVQNRSQATDCDVNIYNSLFYNAFEFEGESFEFEVPVAGLIDGTNCLSTFSYWLSSYDPDDPTETGTNAIYLESIPLFVQDYDFDAGRDGDYALYVSDVSQGIDAGTTEPGRYRNGEAIRRDFSGANRKSGGAVDVGALESESSATNLRALDGARVSRRAIVSGEVLTISNVGVENIGDAVSEPFVVRFFGSLDGALDSGDAPIAERSFLGLGAGETRRFDVLAPTLSLEPGLKYWIFWRIETRADVEVSNDVGALETPIVVYGEDPNPREVEFERSGYSVQRGNSLELGLSSGFVAPESAGYYFDLGDGAFWESSRRGWISPGLVPEEPGTREIVAKVVDLDAGKVVAVGRVALTTLSPSPTLDVRAESLAGGAATRLSLSVRSSAWNRPIKKWSIEWSDGTKEEFEGLGYDLTVARFLDPGIDLSKTLAIATVTDFDGESTRFAIPGRVLEKSATDSIFAEIGESESFWEETRNADFGGTAVSSSSDGVIDSLVAFVSDFEAELRRKKRTVLVGARN
ncbi:MAG: hypothetical protein IJM30_01210 [Thermoguttaceae bacterium]|nr:hypothetical protein [Thermoguttaceae bacterium]